MEGGVWRVVYGGRCMEGSVWRVAYGGWRMEGSVVRVVYVTIGEFVYHMLCQFRLFLLQ